MNILKFDIDDIKIQKFFEELFNTDVLEKLHHIYRQDNDRDVFTSFNDNTTYFHKHFFDNIDTFNELYIKLIETIFSKI